MYPQRSVMTCGLATALEPPHFNHAPVWGAIGAIQYVAGYVTKFQSTHPRGVRRPRLKGHVDLAQVSIHAPAWGATPRWWLSPEIRHCFNPRTRVGCDPCGTGPRRPGWPSFNPRTRVGYDIAANFWPEAG